MFTRFLSLCLILSLLALPSFASESGGGGDNNDQGDFGGTTGLSDRTTRAIIKILTRDFRRCQNERKIYRWDCYRQVYRHAGSQLNGRSSYAGAQEALRRVEQVLDAAVTRHRDPTQPTKRRMLQTYAPVKPEAIPQIRAQTERAMKQAQTMLLRAPPHTLTHYTRIAQAIDSNKVLLRSLLMMPGRLFRLAAVLVSKATL